MTTLDLAFSNPDPSVRLNAALQAGLSPAPSDLDALIEQCAVEPDFQVREMLTWALIRLPPAIAVPRLVAELDRPEPQARSQALHTLSKFRDGSSWPAVAARLDDPHTDVVRTAWYASVAVVPEGKRGWLANKLAAKLGWGEPDVQRSLSRALAALGKDDLAPVLAVAAQHKDPAVREHAAAIEKLLADPDSAFAPSIKTARREVAQGRTKSAKG